MAKRHHPVCLQHVTGTTTRTTTPGNKPTAVNVCMPCRLHACGAHMRAGKDSTVLYNRDSCRLLNHTTTMHTTLELVPVTLPSVLKHQHLETEAINHETLDYLSLNHNSSSTNKTPRIARSMQHACEATAGQHSNSSRSSQNQASLPKAPPLCCTSPSDPLAKCQGHPPGPDQPQVCTQASTCTLALHAVATTHASTCQSGSQDRAGENKVEAAPPMHTHRSTAVGWPSAWGPS